MTSFFSKIVHGAGAVAKDAGKVAKVAAPVAIAVLPVVAGPIGAMGGKLLGLVGAHIADAQEQLPLTGVDTMNPLETFAIMVIMSAIQQTVKNPQHAAQARTQLLGLASDIFASYGVPVPEIPPLPQANPVGAASTV